jgi:hypothetical protein
MNAIRFGAAAYVQVGQYNWLEQEAVTRLVREQLGDKKVTVGMYGAGDKGYRGNTWDTMVFKAPMAALKTALGKVNRILEVQTGQGLSVQYVKKEPNDRTIRTYETAAAADGKSFLA